MLSIRHLLGFMNSLSPGIRDYTDTCVNSYAMKKEAITTLHLKQSVWRKIIYIY